MKNYAKDMIIDFKETDRFLYMKMDAFVQMLNTTSMYHTVNLGMEPGYMEKKGLVWVLYQWRVHLEDGNYYAKKLTFNTFAIFKKDIYSHRYFLVLDEEEKIVGYAVSVWIVIDMNKRKMVKIPKDVQELYTDQEHPEPSVEQQKIIDYMDTSAQRKRNGIHFDRERTFNLRFSDIDSNGHVNNTIYIAWAMESMVEGSDESFLIDNVPEDLSIVYKKERLPAGKVNVKTMINQEETYHEIIDEDGCVLSIVEIKWKKRN